MKAPLEVNKITWHFSVTSVIRLWLECRMAQHLRLQHSRLFLQDSLVTQKLFQNKQSCHGVLHFAPVGVLKRANY